ncbi:gamma-tubulin complex component 4, partial [Paramuricea clavata]
MLHVCHAVMYKQLSAWLLHGLLLDYYDEFFIMMKSATSAGAITSAEQSETEDGKNEEKQVQEKKPASQKTAESHFSLNAEMLPSYISTSVAEKILFVGESVKMLESSMSKSADNRR